MEAREAPRADSPEPLSLFVAATRGSSSDEGDSSSNGAIRGGGDLSSNDGDNAEVSPAGGMGWDAEVRFSIWKRACEALAETTRVSPSSLARLRVVAVQKACLIAGGLLLAAGVGNRERNGRHRGTQTKDSPRSDVMMMIVNLTPRIHTDEKAARLA